MGNALRAHWDRTPAVTRLLCVAYSVLTAAMPLLAQYAPGARELLLCCLHTVLGRRFAWAIFVSVLYRPISHLLSFLLMFLEVFLSSTYLSERERDLGSSRFSAWLLLTAGAVNMVFLSTMALLTKSAGPQFFFATNQGLWPLLMVCITLRHLANPNEPVSVFGLAFVASKWYPVVLAVILSALNGGFQWDVIAAMVVGYMHNVTRMERLLPSPSQAARWEQSCLCSWIRRFVAPGSWVSACGAGSYTEMEGPNQRFATLSELRTAGARRVGTGDLPMFQGRAPGGASFQAFSGSGRRLGR